MKVLMLNGSPRKNGNTMTALLEMQKVFTEEGVESEIVQIGSRPIRGCIACNGCRKAGHCVLDDELTELYPKFEAADGLVLGAPVYYASANGALLAAAQRLFYGSNFDLRMKVGAAVCAARRGGLTATFDELNKFFTISGMPVASGQYWNGVHGTMPGEAVQDLEGMQMMRTLARNMTFLMRAIADAKAKYGLPAEEPHVATNFIR